MKFLEGKDIRWEKERERERKRVCIGNAWKNMKFLKGKDIRWEKERERENINESG